MLEPCFSAASLVATAEDTRVHAQGSMADGKSQVGISKSESIVIQADTDHWARVFLPKIDAEP